jgi:hypothetical protein
LLTAKNLPGKVHEGFWRSLQSLWPVLVPEVKKQMTGGKPLYITGHSKGGGMANLAAMQLAVQERIHATVCTFAGPHPGNAAFAAAYNQTITSTRYEYADDIVPHVPPSVVFQHMFATLPLFRDDPRIAPCFQRLDLDYTAVGTLKFINWDGAIVDDTPMLRFARFEHLARLIMRLGFETIVKDHDSRCGGGYMSAVCPTDVCPQ